MDLAKKKQIDFLINIGLLIPFNNLSLYHGRVKQVNEKTDWKVSFDGVNKHLYKNNIYSINLAEKNIAEEFAYEKSLHGKPEIHRIVPYNDYALILNKEFDETKLTKSQQNKIKEAFKVLVSDEITELHPVKFEERENYIKVKTFVEKYLNDNKIAFLNESDIENLRKLYKADKEFIKKISSSLNTIKLLKNNPVQALNLFLSQAEKGDNNSYFYNWSVLTGFFEKYEIVGVKNEEYSKELHKKVETYSIFDEQKVNTLQQVKKHNELVKLKFESFSKVFNKISKFDFINHEFKEISPEEIMIHICSNPEYGRIYNLPAGVWEGFTVGQHTETTLRVLEDSFKDDLPKDIKPFVIVSLLAHDLGKGVANQSGKNHKLEIKKYAERICSDLKINEKASTLIKFVVEEAQDYTSRYFIKKDFESYNILKQKAKEVLEKIGEKDGGMIDALVDIATIIQTCDSGAYTRYGITRDIDHNFKYFNGNDGFTKSMQKPYDINKKKQRLIEPTKE